MIRSGVSYFGTSLLCLMVGTSCKPIDIGGAEELQNRGSGHWTTLRTHTCDTTVERGDYKVTYQLKFETEAPRNGGSAQIRRAKVQVAGRHRDPKAFHRGSCRADVCTWSADMPLLQVGEQKWVAEREDGSQAFEVLMDNLEVERGGLRSARYTYKGWATMKHYPQRGEGTDVVRRVLDQTSCRSSSESQAFWN